MELSENAASGGRFKALLFDLDDTLYPQSSGLAAVCRQRIQEYMVERLGMEEAEVPELCLKLYHKHGTTMAGLVAAGVRINADEFHAFINGPLPYHALHPDAVLRNLILSVPQRTLIFTNADKEHAFKALRLLGLEDCFEGVICFESIQDPGRQDVVCKPALEAFQRALALAGLEPGETLFLDDSVRNIAAAKAAGLSTVLVGSSVRTEGADYAVESLHNLREAVPQIWEACASESCFDDLIHPATSSIAIEAQVQA